MSNRRIAKLEKKRVYDPWEDLLDQCLLTKSTPSVSAPVQYLPSASDPVPEKAINQSPSRETTVDLDPATESTLDPVPDSNSNKKPDYEEFNTSIDKSASGEYILVRPPEKKRGVIFASSVLTKQ